MIRVSSFFIDLFNFRFFLAFADKKLKKIFCFSLELFGTVLALQVLFCVLFFIFGENRFKILLKIIRRHDDGS